MGGGSSSSSSSRTITNYEPDKVRVAEIEKEKAIAVENLKGNNIKLQKEAKLEIIETNARMEGAIIEAKVRGFDMVAQILEKMTRELNMLGEQRIAMLEQASFSVLEKMNIYYLDFKRKIDDDSNKFMLETTPDMLKRLEELDRESTGYKIYAKQLDTFFSSFISNQNEYIAQIRNQQDKILESNLELKNSISTNINSIVENRVKQLKIAIDNNSEVKALN